MKNKHDSKTDIQRVINKVCFATLLVLAGSLLLAFNLNLIPIGYKPILISWKMLLVVIGACSLVKKQPVGGTLLILTGLFFMLPDLAILFPSFLGGALTQAHLFWPLLLIVGGLLLLFARPKHKVGRFNVSHDGHRKSKKNQPTINNDSDFVEKDVMFSSSEQIVFSSNLEGGDINILLGELHLDLRKVTSLCTDNHLEVNTLFGSAIVYIPAHWQLNMKTSTMFGDIQDKRDIKQNINNETEINNTHTLNLEAACLFGNIEIRN